MQGFVGAMLVIFLTFLIVWAVILLVEYVLKGIALYRMAQNAGFSSPGLAWVPVVNNWLLGSLCDRSQYALTGRQWHFAVILPVLDVLGLVGGSIISGLYGIFNNYLYYGSGYDFFDSSFSSAGGNLLGLACTAVTALALYQLYKDYAPGREVLYVVLSVILGSLAQAILLMTLRNKVPLSASQNPWGGWGQPGGMPPPPPGYYGPGAGGPGTTGWAQPPYQNGPAPGGPGTTGWAQPPYQNGPAPSGPGTTGWAQPPYQNGPAPGGPGTTGWAQPPYQNGSAPGGPGTMGWAQPPNQGGPSPVDPPSAPGPEGQEQGGPPEQNGSGPGYSPPFRWNGDGPSAP